MAKKNQIMIETREQADMALQRIGHLQREIAVAEAEANEKMAAIREEMIDDTELWRDEMAQNVAALEEWATEHKDELFKAPRSIDMNWGRVGFRLTPWKIVILGRLKLKTVLTKLKAHKMSNLIRTKEEIDREKALNYLNSDLAKVGLKKKRSDEFFFEVKQEEVK